MHSVTSYYCCDYDAGREMEPPRLETCSTSPMLEKKTFEHKILLYVRCVILRDQPGTGPAPVQDLAYQDARRDRLYVMRATPEALPVHSGIQERGTRVGSAELNMI